MNPLVDANNAEFETTKAALLTLAALLAPVRKAARLAPVDEQRLRGMLERFGERDSLGYFALRRDKAVIFYDDSDRLPDWRTRYFDFADANGSFFHKHRILYRCRTNRDFFNSQPTNPLRLVSRFHTTSVTQRHPALNCQVLNHFEVGRSVFTRRVNIKNN